MGLSGTIRPVIWRLRHAHARYLNRFRSMWWRFLIPGAPADLRVLGKIYLDLPERLQLGTEVVINEGVYLNCREPVKIGNRVHLSAHVKLNAGMLDLMDPARPHVTAPVTIGDDVWIATGAIINPGVTIHDGVVVGAGAVVSRDLPPYTLCVGVPAKPIRELPRPSQPRP